MSQAIPLDPFRRARAVASGPRVGPAVVRSVDAGRIGVALRDGTEAEAVLALAYPYAPALGDTLLVVSDGDEHWIIGVVEGHGTASLRFEGDVELSANGGTLRLRADRGVAVEAPEVSLVSRSFTLLADAVTERARSWLQHVGELASVYAGKLHTVVEGTHHTQAKSAHLVTEEKVRINGKAIHLG